jgi:hypothetical protein
MACVAALPEVRLPMRNCALPRVWLTCSLRVGAVVCPAYVQSAWLYWVFAVHAKTRDALVLDTRPECTPAVEGLPFSLSPVTTRAASGTLPRVMTALLPITQPV